MSAPGIDKPKKNNEFLWLIVFADMSTNLMLFFLLLFAMSRMTDTEQQRIREGIQDTFHEKAKYERMQKLQKENFAVETLKDTVAHGKLKQYAKIDVDEKNVKLTLEVPVFFPKGSPEMTHEAIVALQSLVPVLKEFPNDIIVEGHTDDTPVLGGIYSSNWELSVARSVSVIAFLVSKGVNPKQMVAGGYGEYHPVAPNDTEENRAKNRRIEITIIRQQQHELKGPKIIRTAQ